MTDTVKEQISALLDGELADGETELLLKRLDRDPELRRTLSRYSLIGAALRTDGEIPAARAVAARVSAALASEPPLTVPAVAARVRWAKLAGGLSVAASVAAVAVMFGAGPARVAATSGAGVQQMQQVAAIARVQPVVLSPAVIAPVALEPLPPGYTTPAVLPDEPGSSARDAQMARYMIAHADYATPLARRSVVSSLVSADAADAADVAAVPASVRTTE